MAPFASPQCHVFGGGAAPALAFALAWPGNALVHREMTGASIFAAAAARHPDSPVLSTPRYVETG